jgi:N-acetyl-alpha-D-muramate 1-phosphate uridylyltransferase
MRLETAGGIVRALPRLSARFFGCWRAMCLRRGSMFSAASRFARWFHGWGQIGPHLVGTQPSSQPWRRFWLVARGLGAELAKAGFIAHLLSTLALYKKEFFDPQFTGMTEGNPQGKAAPLAPLLRSAMDRGQVSASLYKGPWTDVGTPERLKDLNQTTGSL